MLHFLNKNNTKFAFLTYNISDWKAFMLIYGGYVYFYIYLCLCSLDIYAAEPWYLDILLYPVTLISYWLLLQHVRANKASLQILSVSSLLVLHQLLRVDQQHHRPIYKFVYKFSNGVRFEIAVQNWRWSLLINMLKTLKLLYLWYILYIL